MSIDLRFDVILGDIAAEIVRAEKRFKPFNSAHEGYAVLREEVDELWEEVKKKRAHRSHDAMRKEAVQIAAMAIRFIRDVCRPDSDDADRGHG